MQKRPHIIIFNPDEMRQDALAHMGNPAAITPNLDRFMQEDAVSFRNAFCQNPVCVPSRCSFFTGLYPHVNGHRTMAHLLRPGESSLFSELKNSGYYVWQNARNDLYAAQYDGWFERNADESFYGGKAAPPGPENPAIRGPADGKNYYSHFEGRLKLDEYGRNYTKDDEALDAMLDRLLHPVDDRPICAFLGLMYPHAPYQAEEPYYSAIDRKKLPRRIRPEECTGKPRMEELIRRGQHMEAYTEADWDELRAVYQAMVMKVDAQFGRMVQVLKEQNLYDDCAIFFFSDHGDFDGDYGLPEKAQNCFEDCLTRVPLLIKPPKWMPVDPGIADGMVELVDFYATAMELAQATPDHTHFGKSLLGILEDRSRTVREYAFCEGGRMPEETHCDEYHLGNGNLTPPSSVYYPRQMAQLDSEAHIKGTMIRSRQYKLISRQNGEDEFYDLTEDPGERENRIRQDRYSTVIAKMERELLRWYQGTCDIVPMDFDRRFNAEMLWVTVKNRVPRGKEQLVREKIHSGAPLLVVLSYCAQLANEQEETNHEAK